MNGALLTPGYLLRELSHVPRGLTEIAQAKQVRKTNQTSILRFGASFFFKCIIYSTPFRGADYAYSPSKRCNHASQKQAQTAKCLANPL